MMKSHYLKKNYNCSYCKVNLFTADYICIKGRIALELWDKETKMRSFVFVSPKPINNVDPEMYFCNAKHFQDYCLLRKKEVEEERVSMLRHEATMESLYGPNYKKSKEYKEHYEQSNGIR
jgi:hypothetical protein